jgi:hypothetical protein
MEVRERDRGFVGDGEHPGFSAGVEDHAIPARMRVDGQIFCDIERSVEEIDPFSGDSGVEADGVAGDRKSVV